MSTEPLAPPTFRDYLRILARRWWVVVLGIVGFTLLFLAYTYKDGTIYTSASEVRVQSGVDLLSNGSSTSHASTGTQNADILTYVEVIKSTRFENEIIKQNHLKTDGIKQVRAGNVTGTNAIKITIGMANKTKAAFVANRYAQAFVASVEAQQAALTAARNATTNAAVHRLQDQVTGITAAITVEATRIDAQDASLAAAGRTPLRTSALLTSLQAELQQVVPTYSNALQTSIANQVATASAQPVVDQIADATPSATPIQPAPIKYGLVGFVIGLIMGIAGAFVFELLTDKVRTRQDVERFSRLPVLATVPRGGSRAGATTRPVVLADPASPKAEAYRAARAGVQFLSMRSPMRRILVTGLRPKDLQDIAAANLAVTLAASGSRVVLVDADLRDGKLHDQFGLTHGVGLTSVLVGDTPLADALRPVEVPGGALRVLATGPLPPNPADLVASEALAAVLTKLAVGADFVVVSSPPLLPYNDALTLARHADGVIMVVTARRTRRRYVADGAAKLRRVGAPAVGVVLDGGSRGADAYEASVGRVHIGDGLTHDLPPAPASV
jgi:capsular exopolysaccharide synthesis family protein